jgi:hypothetical protein
LILDEIKPYKTGNPVLWALHGLANSDKHRMLVTCRLLAQSSVLVSTDSLSGHHDQREAGEDSILRAFRGPSNGRTNEPLFSASSAIHRLALSKSRWHFWALRSKSGVMSVRRRLRESILFSAIFLSSLRACLTLKVQWRVPA